MTGATPTPQKHRSSLPHACLPPSTHLPPPLPPQPTEEMTRSLDELIKARIAEGQFDDVVRLVAPPPEVKKATVELDDSKPQQGLGELYEAEYTRAVAGAADDKVGDGVEVLLKESECVAVGCCNVVGIHLLGAGKWAGRQMTTAAFFLPQYELHPPSHVPPHRPTHPPTLRRTRRCGRRRGRSSPRCAPSWTR